jgi:peptidoglycan/xylan/chitin deacetylase (PgdA/CDA1 family)
MNKTYNIFYKLFLISIFLLPIYANSNWVIINDDGTTSIYKPKDKKVYKAPIKKREITKNPIKIIEPKDKPSTSEKIMYLTFDDGPLLGSNNIITVLQQENIQATMFMVGKHVKKRDYNKKIFKRAIKEPLILVANHTYTHANGRYREFYRDKKGLLLDMQRMDDFLIKSDKNHHKSYCRLAGRNVFRLPKICRNDPGIPKRYKEVEKYDALWELGYYIFGWDFQWTYNPKNGKINYPIDKLINKIEYMYKKGKTKNQGKFVLLMHDFCFRDKYDGQNNLRKLIKRLKANGWKFESLDTYL